MHFTHPPGFRRLLTQLMGSGRAEALLDTLEVPRGVLVSDPRAPHARTSGRVPRVQLAMALAALLFEDVLRRVPMARAYVEDARRAGRRLLLDHGALRTVAAPSGELPPGHAAFARLLEPLGYARRGRYDLDRLGMTGFAYGHLDLPQVLPQYFVSEVHPERFSPAFVGATQRVLASSRDPLGERARGWLAELGERGHLAEADALSLLPELAACFARQHAEPSLADYALLLAESPEMAWIATEGNAFNHATDRVEDAGAVAQEQRRLGRPVKDRLEVSRSGRVLQTAFRAQPVERFFRDARGNFETRTVPGSFHEFITRRTLPDGTLDLAFDAGNAQSIFRMTAAGDPRP